MHYKDSGPLFLLHRVAKCITFFFLATGRSCKGHWQKCLGPPNPHLYNFSENVSKAKDFVTSPIINIPYFIYSKTFWNQDTPENSLWQCSFSCFLGASYNQRHLTVNKTEAIWWRRHPSQFTPPSQPWKALTNPQTLAAFWKSRFIWKDEATAVARCPHYIREKWNVTPMQGSERTALHKSNKTSGIRSQTSAFPFLKASN